MKRNMLYYRPDILLLRFLERFAVAYREKCFKAQEERHIKKWNTMFEDKNFIILPLDEKTNMHFFQDSDLCKHMYFCAFEENELSFLKRYLRKGDIFFDIGANIGLFSLLASNVVEDEGEIYAFEPTPETFKRLDANIELNNFTNIKSHQFAFSNEIGELPFHISTDGSDAFNSFARVKKLENGDTISVKTITVDHFIQTENIPIADIKLVKIDVEGWEMNVFKGAVDFLSHPDAPALMVEFTDANAIAAGTSCGKIFDFIKSFGYNWYTYKRKNNKLIFEEKRELYPYMNLIAIKNLDVAKERLEI